MSSSRGKGRALPKQADRWPPPSFAFYASDTLVSQTFRTATPEERGLLITMLAECWVNDTLPADKEALARLLGWNAVQLERACGQLIDAHFRPAPGDEGAPARLFCPELERQKQRMSHIREKQAAAGRQTARTRREAAANKQESSSRSATGSASSSARSFAHAPELKELKEQKVVQSDAVGGGLDAKAPEDPMAAHADFVRALD